MPCSPICPASDALCIAGFKQASACQPPTQRNIARAASTVFISRLIHMLYYCSTVFHIIQNPSKHKHRQFHFAFNGNGNKRLRHAIRCFVLAPAFEGLNSESGWCGKSKIQTPKSKRPVWILEFGFWILDFGFWFLDRFSLRSFCGGPKRGCLHFGVWISDFKFWVARHRLDPA